MLVIKWLMLIAFMLFMSVIAFAHDEKLSSIGEEQVKLLRLQLETMERYSDILWARLDDLEG